MYLRKHSLFQTVTFVASWTTIIFTLCFNLNRICNGEAFVQSSSGRDQHEKLPLLHCCLGNSTGLMVLTSLKQGYCAGRKRHVDNPTNATLCGKWITGNFTHLRKPLKIINSKVSSLCEHYYMTGLMRLYQSGSFLVTSQL